MRRESIIPTGLDGRPGQFGRASTGIADYTDRSRYSIGTAGTLTLYSLVYISMCTMIVLTSLSMELIQLFFLEKLKLIRYLILNIIP